MGLEELVFDGLRFGGSHRYVYLKWNEENLYIEGVCLQHEMKACVFGALQSCRTRLGVSGATLVPLEVVIG